MTDVQMYDRALIKALTADNERLRTQCGGNCRYWEGRWRDEAKENERLAALVIEAEKYNGYHQLACLEIERLEEALEWIEQWSRAYPLSIFPKPDLKRARELLEAGGMMLDAISADAMRHVVEGVGEIARMALEPKL